MLPEVGAAELLVIAAIALIVVGPKDLPILMRKVGQFLNHMRSMAAEFRSSFDELARQSELDELRKEVEAMREAARNAPQAAAAHVGLDQMEAEIGQHWDPHAPMTAQTELEPQAEPEPAPEPEPKPAPRKRTRRKPAPPEGQA